MNGTRISLSKNAPPLHFERAYIKITFCGKWSIFANHVTYSLVVTVEDVLQMTSSVSSTTKPVSSISTYYVAGFHVHG